MNKINYFDERELLVRREIETKTPKPKAYKCYPFYWVCPIMFIPRIDD